MPKFFINYTIEATGGIMVEAKNATEAYKMIKESPYDNSNAPSFQALWEEADDIHLSIGSVVEGDDA